MNNNIEIETIIKIAKDYVPSTALEIHQTFVTQYKEKHFSEIMNNTNPVECQAWYDKRGQTFARYVGIHYTKKG